MKWFRAAAFGLVSYGTIVFLFVITEVLGIPSGPIAFGAVVLNLFLTLGLSYAYFKAAGVGARNEGVVLGALWVSEAVVLEYAFSAIFFSNALVFVDYAPFWIYNAERMFLPLVFSGGLIQIKKEV